MSKSKKTTNSSNVMHQTEECANEKLLFSCHSFRYTSHATCKSSVGLMHYKMYDQAYLPMGGYSVPFFSVFGSQSHQSLLGIESMIEGTCIPQPNQVRLPSEVVSKEAGILLWQGEAG